MTTEIRGDRVPLQQTQPLMRVGRWEQDLEWVEGGGVRAVGGVGSSVVFVNANDFPIPFLTVA